MNLSIISKLLSGRSLDRRSLIKFLIKFFGLFFFALVVTVIFIIVNAVAVLPWSPLKATLSGTVHFASSAVMGGLICFILISILLNFIKFLTGPNRGDRVVKMFSAAIIGLVLIHGSSFAIKLQFAGLERLALKSKDLIHAIKTFEVENDAPPPNLEALVPKYFATLPTPGLAAYNEYKYEVLSQSPYWKGNRWKLSVSGVFMFDEFYYLPKQNYCEVAGRIMEQDSKFCGSYELIGDWAYFHE
ncbi:MAG: hypothetical protein ACOX2O_08860 [Bdellovibrionota bacterium]|jgi:hypothetical protein